MLTLAIWLSVLPLHGQDGIRLPSTGAEPAAAQDTTVSCGVGAAYLLLKRLGCAVALEEIEAASPVRADAPMSFAELQELFHNLGFVCEGLRMPLQQLNRPVIAFRPHPKGNVGHFVVVEPIDNQDSGDRGQTSDASVTRPSSLNAQHFLLLDPIDQPIKVSRERLSEAWDGRVLVVYSPGVSPPNRAFLRLNQSGWSLFLMLGAPFMLAVAAIGYLLRRRLAMTEISLLAPSISVLRRASMFVWAVQRFSGQWWRVLAFGFASAAVCACAAYTLVRGGSRPFVAAAADRASSAQDAPAPVQIDVPEFDTTILVENGTSVDFGEVKLGEELTHTIEVRNIGPLDLPVAKLKMNCACNAQVEYDRNVCRPGETARIQISTNAAGYGPQRKPIPFAVNRSGHLETLFTLELMYRVAWLEQAQFVPTRLELGELSSVADAMKRELELILIGPPEGPDPELNELESDTAAIRAELVRRERVVRNADTVRAIPAQRVRFLIRLIVDPRQLPFGKFHGHVIARASIGEVKLHCTGEVCPPIIASPASLLVGKSATPTRHLIRLRLSGERPGHAKDDRASGTVRVVSANTTVPGVSCVVDNERNQVAVVVEPDSELSVGASVTIVARAGEADETIHVPLVEF